MTQTILVIGASGYTGTAFVPQAARAGHQVHAHFRTGSPSLQRSAEAFRSVGAHIHECAFTTDELNALVRSVKPDIVCGFLGITRAGAAREEKRTGKRPNYQEVDFGYTNMALQACRAHAPAARFLYLSSTGISDSEPSNAYMHARWVMEKELRASGQPWTIARPSFITGDNRQESRPAERFAGSLVGGIGGALRALGMPWVDDHWGPMTNEQLASALLNAATAPDCQNRILEAADLRKRLG
jgi:uncharacterized protein YbjT (DUF2867 family)